MSEAHGEPLLHDPREDDDALDDLAPTNGDVDAETASTAVLDVLRAQRDRVVQEHVFDVVVPGWRDLLVLRLGAVSGPQMERLTARLGRPNATATFNVGVIVASFRSVLGRTTPTGELTTIVDSDGDPVGLDKRLADALGLGPVESAREVVERLFQYANSPTFALAAAANEWGEWARGAGDEIDESFVGE